MESYSFAVSSFHQSVKCFDPLKQDNKIYMYIHYCTRNYKITEIVTWLAVQDKQTLLITFILYYSAKQSCVLHSCISTCTVYICKFSKISFGFVHKMYQRDDLGGIFYGYTCVQKLQCNKLNWGHPIFFCQSQDKFRTKESKFVHFGPITNVRT